MFDRDAIVARVAKLKEGLGEMRGYLKIEERQGRLAAAEARQAEPGFWDNPEAARVRLVAIIVSIICAVFVNNRHVAPAPWGRRGGIGLILSNVDSARTWHGGDA